MYLYICDLKTFINQNQFSYQIKLNDRAIQQTLVATG